MPEEFVCPACRIALHRVRMKEGVFWACNICGGRALSVELLRQRFADESINPFWIQVVRGQGAPGRPCPCCGRNMVEVPVASTAEAPLIEVCRLCHFVWFDPKEIQALTPRIVGRPGPLDFLAEEQPRFGEED